MLMAQNMDLESGPDIVTDFRWWTEDKLALKEILKCSFHCGPGTQGENSNPIPLCHLLYFQSALES